MTPIKLACASLLAMTVLASALAAANGPGHRGAHEGQMMHGPMRAMQLHGLDLSDVQRDKVFAIMHEQAPKLHEQMGRMHKAQAALREMALSGKLDDARANALSQDIGSAASAMALLHARADVQVAAVLTPEQRKRLAEQTAHPRGHQ
jgi:periplasmic protein CpxP/Spy